MRELFFTLGSLVFLYHLFDLPMWANAIILLTVLVFDYCYLRTKIKQEADVRALDLLTPEDRAKVMSLMQTKRKG